MTTLSSNAGPLRPFPEGDELSKPFFDGLKAKKLLIQCCSNCSAYHLAAYRCVHCKSLELIWLPASGQATLYSFIVVRQVADPFFAARTPYAAAVAELAEGPRVYAPVIDLSEEALKVGAPGRMAFSEEAGIVHLAFMLDRTP